MYLSELLSDLPWYLQIIARLVAAAILGGLIGLEREHRGRSAGFRTQMLVALGAAIAMSVGLQFAYTDWATEAADYVQIDPTRIAYGVMGGIGFIGGGTIIVKGVGVQGLTTAASLWCCAAVGLATGYGMFEVGFASTLLILLVLGGLTYVDRFISRRWYRRAIVTMDRTNADGIREIRRTLCDRGIHVVGVDWEVADTDDHQQVRFRLSGRNTDPLEVGEVLLNLPRVHHMELTEDTVQ
ncbi:MAG: MgtC/SapB family protein [Phycisphaerae bacterium]